MQLFDTHTHLDAEEFAHDWEPVWQRAREAGVKYAANAGAYPPTWERSLELNRRFPEILPCIGIHPMVIDRFGVAELEKMKTLLETGAFVAISEIGLDPHFTECPLKQQEFFFRAQLELSQKFSLPVCLHIRKAHTRVLEILDEVSPTKWRGIAHCFSGSQELALEFTRRGFLISFAGPLTNPNAKKLHRMATELPLEQIVVETDSPDLPPRNLRQARNEPAFIIEVVKKLAELRQQPINFVTDTIFDNACKLFGMDAK
jgi:TatD DNase family protein